MLKTLRIRNLATIEDLRVEFGEGLGVLTGETGAGKSIVVDALGLACGERGDSGLVRAGSDRAVIEAAFAVPPGDATAALLEAHGVDPAEGEIVVRREIGAGSAGRVLINGSPTTVAVLREVGEALADLHGQHEQQGLLAPERHLALLDAFGGYDDELAAVASAHASSIAADERLARLTQLGREAKVREAALREALREIRGVDPRPGELDALRRDRAILADGARVATLLDEAIARLDEGDDPAISRVHGAERRVAELARIDPSLAELTSRLASARLDLQDARDTLVAYRDAANFDPGRLEAIESRRVAIEKLLLRWGPSEEDAHRAADDAQEELATLENIDDELAAARAQAAQARGDYAAAAGALTRRRREAAARLGPAIEAELAPLALPKARFTVSLPPARGPLAGDGAGAVPFHPKGAERAEFLLAANPGEPARPLGKAASGGELSRVMLALHVVLDASGDRRVLVFDEVDAGVSGAVALAVGARLARLAARHQVLCVTHLPQVAAHATGHYHVRKRVAGGRTHTEIVALSGAARVDELARMLGGRQATEASRENAAELLAEAGQAARARGGRR
jgi:DNA repair protein RecN (Recombination protein N)